MKHGSIKYVLMHLPVLDYLDNGNGNGVLLFRYVSIIESPMRPTQVQLLVAVKYQEDQVLLRGQLRVQLQMGNLDHGFVDFGFSSFKLF